MTSGSNSMSGSLLRDDALRVQNVCPIVRRARRGCKELPMLDQESDRAVAPPVQGETSERDLDATGNAVDLIHIEKETGPRSALTGRVVGAQQHERAHGPGLEPWIGAPVG
jgi:hypothetical protein